MELASPEKALQGKNDLISFGERPGFNFGVLLCWLAIFIAVGATVYFWFANRNISAVLAEKRQERDEVISEMTGPSYADVEKRAAGFKAAVEKLSEVNAKSYSASIFLTELYKRITVDAEITAVSLKSDGTLALDGKTKSYRSIADLSLALTSWPALKDVDIATSAVTVDSDGRATANFSITAKIDKTISPGGAGAAKGIQ